MKQAIKISLSDDHLGAVRSLIASGQYATIEEVVISGIVALAQRQQMLESWLHDQAIPNYERLKENPSSGMTIEEVRRGLAKRKSHDRS